MTPDQVMTVLAYASAVDPRVRRNDPDERQLQAAAWYAQLRHVDVGDAKAAVDAHYADAKPDAIMPGQVRTLASTTGPSAYRPLAENVAAIEAAHQRETRGEPAAIEGRSGRAALQEALDELAARWSAPAPESPTGYERRRGLHGPGAAADTSKRLAADQRDRDTPVVDGRTDAARAKAGKAITICHDCAVDIPAPSGWDPAKADSPPLLCGRCNPAAAREAS
jgi:hypothetical protein